MKKKKFIIVGASPKLLNYQLGPLIDKFDYICRFNDYHTENFEKHVGSKTTHWITGVSKQSIIKKRNIKGLYVICSYPLHIYENIPSRLRRARRIYNRLRINPLRCHEISKSDIKKIIDISGISYPSTGLMGITYFTFIKKYDVTITGFDFYTESDPHYYKHKPLEVDSSHDFEAERALVSKWLSEGHLNILGFDV